MQVDHAQIYLYAGRPLLQIIDVALHLLQLTFVLRQLRLLPCMCDIHNDPVVSRPLRGDDGSKGILPFRLAPPFRFRLPHREAIQRHVHCIAKAQDVPLRRLLPDVDVVVGVAPSSSESPDQLVTCFLHLDLFVDKVDHASGVIVVVKAKELQPPLREEGTQRGYS
jgi:hypothetical protein